MKSLLQLFQSTFKSLKYLLKLTFQEFYVGVYVTIFIFPPKPVKDPIRLEIDHVRRHYCQFIPLKYNTLAQAPCHS